MANENTTERTAKKVAKLNLEAPIWIAVDQAETRNYFEIFNGWDAEKECKDWAAERSARLKRQIAIVGPLDSIATPPQNLVGVVKKAVLSKPIESADT